MSPVIPMVMLRSGRPANLGFTLAELAIVLVIIATLIGGLLVPLSAQVDVRRTSETQTSLAEIREALLGFAVIYRRLPCPSSENDPNSPSYGIEDPACNAALTQEAYLPWKTLGVSETDAWGSHRTSATDPGLGTWRYRVDRNFAAAPFTLSTTFQDNLQVKDNAGHDLTTASERAVAIVFSTGADKQPNGENASLDAIYQAGERTTNFDDIVIWIGRPVLFSRMVAAGRLP